MIKYIIILAAILTGLTELEAKKMNINIDLAQFNSSEGIICEVYYTFPDTTFKYIPDEKGYKGELFFSIKIKAAEGLVTGHRWIVTNYVDTIRKNHLNDLIGQQNFALDPGQYKLEINIKDLHDESSGAEKEFDLVIRDFNDNNIALSDIQLAKIIEKKDEAKVDWDKKFLKSNLYVIPNPRSDYFGEEPKLTAYYELYNARKFSKEGITIDYRILDGARREVFKHSEKNYPDKNELAQIISIPLNALPTGKYYFTTTINPSSNLTDTITGVKQFYLFNQDIPPQMDIQFTESKSFENSIFSAMNSDQVDELFNQSSYIATKSEKRAYKNLSELKAKQRFLYRFWDTRDPDTSTVINERLVELREAIKYANTYFKFGNTPGWKTERGRVLLEYGFPTQRDRHMADENQKPYEEWFYDEIQGGVRFYFVDRSGYGNFILVHSTAYGEMYDPDWFEKYVKSRDDF
ncbi:MAG: GWxTD domain-containing protein [Candidatus Kapaibacterium sp.]